jgi:hypothetical protein
MKVLKLEYDLSSCDTLPKISDFLTSKPILFMVDGKRYAGHYHMNGWFYVADHNKYESKLFNAKGPKASVMPSLIDNSIPDGSKVTSWEYLNA